MTTVSTMLKQIPATGVLNDKTPGLFTRNDKKSRFRGLATFNTADVSVLLEVADTPALKSKGLMGRNSLPACCGMLFTGLCGGSFWMKGCKIPLDIIFLGTNNKITKKYTMEADGGVRRYAYDDEEVAIELPAGFCSKHYIDIGDKCDWRVW